MRRLRRAPSGPGPGPGRPAVAALVLLLAACGDAPSAGPANPGGSSGQPPGFIVVTAGGTALANGDGDVPPTLDLRVTAGRPLSTDEVSARLDGTELAPIAGSGGGVGVTVPPMALGSAHHLDLAVAGRPPAAYAFTVVAPAAAQAALHTDPQAGTVLDVAFALAPDQASVTAHLPAGGSPRWVDADHVRLTWSGAPGGRLDLPGSIGTARGSHLAGTLRLDLGPVAAGGLRLAAVPAAAPAAPARTGLVVGFSVGHAGSRASAAGHAAQLSVLSPTGLTAAADGSLSGAPDSASVTAATGAGVPLIPVVQLLDAGAVDALLQDPAGPARLVATIRGRAAEAGWAGVQLDVENIPAADRDAFSALVAALAAALHADARRLLVDAVPHRPGHVTSASAGYDLSAIGRAADWVVLMAYPEHGAGDAPGPLAGLDWERQMLAGSVPELGGPSHAILGVPVYAMTWDGAGGAGVADAYEPAVAAALATPGARVDADFAAGATFIVAGTAVTYADGAAGLAARFSLAAGSGLAGVAMWRLGFEDPALWTQLPGTAAVRLPGA